jgi:hypothetical protein
MWEIVMGELITNAEYKNFKPEHTYPEGHDKKPVGNVSFQDAMEYAAWLSKKTGRCFRLPTEEETIEAERTFKCDFSAWPLKEKPDVGTVGSNADGVTGLLGHMFAWQATQADVDKARKGWEENVKENEVKPTTTHDDELEQILEMLERKKTGIEAQIKDLNTQMNRIYTTLDKLRS